MQASVTPDACCHFTRRSGKFLHVVDVKTLKSTTVASGGPAVRGRQQLSEGLAEQPEEASSSWAAKQAHKGQLEVGESDCSASLKAAEPQAVRQTFYCPPI